MHANKTSAQFFSESAPKIEVATTCDDVSINYRPTFIGECKAAVNLLRDVIIVTVDDPALSRHRASMRGHKAR